MRVLDLRGRALPALAIAFVTACSPASTTPSSPTVSNLASGGTSGTSSVVLNASALNLPVGVGQTLQASAFDGDGNRLTDVAVTWSVSSQGVVSLAPDGMEATVVGLKAGTANVTASYGGVTASVTATISNPTSETLAIHLSGTGAGSVTSAPTGINCGSMCGAYFDPGATVTLTAAPDASSTFTGWSGACSGTAATCTLTMNANLVATASFVAIPGESSSSSGSSGSSSSGSGGSSSGSSGSLSGSSSSGSSGSTPSSSSASASSSSGAVNTVSITLAGDGTGSVVSTPAGINCDLSSPTTCSGSFPASTTRIALTYSPSATSSFVSASGPSGSAPCLGSGPHTTCSIALTANGTTDVTATFSSWQVLQPFPTSMTALIESMGTYLAIGAGGSAATSTDGIAWTGQTLPVSSTLRAAATDGMGSVVAVGDDGTILTWDGIDPWTSAGSGVTSTLSGVACGRGVWVAVGASGTILTSSSGTPWTAATSSSTQDLRAVVYADQLFVAVGADGTILISSNGDTWSPPIPGLGITQPLNAVTYDGNQFIAVGGAGTVLTSPEGSTWTKSNAPTTSALVGIASSGSTYVALANLTTSTGGVAAFSSTDLIRWNLSDSELVSEAGLGVAYAGGAFFGLGGSGSIVRSTDGSSWSPNLPGAAVTQLTSVRAGSQMVMAIGTNGAVFTSSNGTTWTSRGAGTAASWSGNLAYGNGLFVAVTRSNASGANDWQIVSSLDGTQWQTRLDRGTTPLSIADVAYGTDGQGFVAVGSTRLDGGAEGGEVLTSPDGVSWTDVSDTLNLAGHLHTITYGDGMFAAAGDALYTSPDGIRWTAPSVALTQPITSLSYGNDLFVGIAVDSTTGGNAKVVTCSDNGTWNVTALGSTLPFPLGVAAGNGEFLSFVSPAASAEVATSTNGTDWTLSPVPLIANTSAGLTYSPSIGWVAIGQPETFLYHP